MWNYKRNVHFIFLQNRYKILEGYKILVSTVTKSITIQLTRINEYNIHSIRGTVSPVLTIQKIPGLIVVSLVAHLMSISLSSRSKAVSTHDRRID
jgi:hypothetical protein